MPKILTPVIFFQQQNKFTDVWKTKQEMNNPHPASFPEELIDRIINSTDGSLVLDPFGSSGTTAVSSIKDNKNFILIEKSMLYCEMAKARIEGKEDWRNVSYNSSEDR